MKANLKKILDTLPNKPPRSRLEPYRELIEELRRRGRSYRDIAVILAEKCAVEVTGSGIHDFLRTRSRAKANGTSTGRGLVSNPGPIANRVPVNTVAGSASDDGVHPKIAALKARKTLSEPGSGGFEHNPDEPLRLMRLRQE